MSPKLCEKGGYHTGRPIQALCLQSSCSSDRLLCFYCKHQSHRNHETAYFPTGLPASLENLNQNSRIQNAPKQKQKIDKKFLSIKNGWQNIEQTMEQYLKDIQSQINQNYQTIENTFSQTSVIQIKERLSTKKLPHAQIQKCIKMINMVNKYELNNDQKIKMYSKLKQRVLTDVFDSAASQIQKLMQDVQQNSKNLDFTSAELTSYIQNHLKGKKYEKISSQTDIPNAYESEDLQKYLESEFTNSQIDKEQNLKFVAEQNQQNQKDERNFSQKQFQFFNKQRSQQKSFAKLNNGYLFQPVQQNLRINIGKSLVQNEQPQSFQIQEKINNRSLRSKDHLEYNLKVNNTSTFTNFQQEYKNNTGKRDSTHLIQQNENQKLQFYNKKSKKIKTNQQVDIKIESNQQKQRKIYFNKKLATIFDDKYQNSISSKNYQSQSKDQIYEESSENNTQKQQVNVKNIDQKSKSDLDLNPQKSDQLLSDQKEWYATIQKKCIRCPQDVQLPVKMTHFIILGQNDTDIYQNLQILDPSIMKKLQIYCDTTEKCIDQECVDIICQMSQLKSLMIYMTSQLQKKQVKRLIENLPNLQELILCEFNDMDLELAKTMKRCLPKLRRFYYNFDNKNYLQKMEENYQFLVDIASPQTDLKVVRTLSEIPLLQTIELINIPSQIVGDVLEALTHMKNLKQISIKNSSDDIELDCSEIIKYLASSKHNFKVVCLENIRFKEKQLVQIFKNSTDLNTLIVNDCVQLLNSSILTLAKNCQKLEQLSLMLTDCIHGKQIYTFQNLRTLILRACWNIDSQYFLEHIPNLKNLQCLSVTMNNFWFNDRLMPEVVKLNKLKILNLDTTKVTDKGLQEIYKLKNLQTLICGKTQVSFEGLIKAMYHPKTGAKNDHIKKLSLSKDENYSRQINQKKKKNPHDIIIKEFYGKHLIALGQALPLLTHLSVGGFLKVQQKHFQTLKNLKCLAAQDLQLTEKIQDWLQNKKNVNLHIIQG